LHKAFIGRIKEVDPQFKGAIHDFEAVFFWRVPAKVHGP